MANLEGIFTSAESTLSIRLSAIQSAFNHAGMKGAALEASIRSFLREILPANLGVTSGVVMDSHGGISKQIDIIIYDAAKTPLFFGAEEMYLVPIECVYFTVEVKTKLTLAELEGCIKNAESVKNLLRTAYYYPNGIIEHTKEVYAGCPTKSWDVVSLVFAMEAGGVEPLVKRLSDHREETTDIRKQLDSILIFGDSAIIDTELVPPRKFKLSLTPSKNSIPAIFDTNPTFTFFAHFSRLYNQASIPDFDFTQYVNFGKSVKIHDKGKRSQRVLRSAAENGFVFVTDQQS